MIHEEQARALDELAAMFGVTRGYHDGTGRERRASDEAVAAVLAALGAPMTHAGEAAQALHSLRSDAATRPSPLVVLGEGEGGNVPCPAAAPGRALLLLESGEEIALDREPGAPLRVPRDTPVGYHRLVPAGSGDAALVHVMVAPRRLPPAPKGWGLFAPLYALRPPTAAAPDLATYGDLVRLSKWMVEAAPAGRHGRDRAYLGTLPLLACFFEEPFEPSPYSPISRAFWSELYVDPRAAEEFDAGASTCAAPASAASAHGILDYRTAMRRRRADLEALLRNLDRNGGRRRDDFEAAVEEDPELARYAAFRAAVERYGCTWQGWPAHPREGTLRPGADYDGEAFRYHAYAQWLARQQVGAAAAASAAGLYLDLPLGSHGGGYDTWRHSGAFAAGVSVGAPPDAVFAGGQDWGFPPLHPVAARLDGHAALRAALRHHFAHAALLRVDHVMGLHRLFWIPQGMPASEGVYVPYPADELWAVLSIEASRARGGRGAAVVGEDLGTVPDEVRAQMTARGALRMHVVPFECRADSGAAIASAPEASLACLGTHDMEPFAAWWEAPGTLRAEIAAFLGLDAQASAGEALPALLAWLSASEATVICATLEDLWLERERQNLPGTEAADRNWRRPFARGLDDFCADAAIARLVALVRAADAPQDREDAELSTAAAASPVAVAGAGASR
ncbi:MAG: 4-alpha-glucanotransferase [Candidatus Binatia bacterium]